MTRSHTTSHRQKRIIRGGLNFQSHLPAEGDTGQLVSLIPNIVQASLIGTDFSSTAICARSRRRNGLTTYFDGLFENIRFEPTKIF